MASSRYVGRMLRFAWILCLAAACGSQSSPSKSGSAAAPSDPASGSATDPAPGDTPHAVGAEACGPDDCGPAMKMPTRQCPDGSTAGPTGNCLRQPNGHCGWEIRKCP